MSWRIFYWKIYRWSPIRLWYWLCTRSAYKQLRKAGASKWVATHLAYAYLWKEPPCGNKAEFEKLLRCFSDPQDTAIIDFEQAIKDSPYCGEDITF